MGRSNSRCSGFKILREGHASFALTERPIDQFVWRTNTPGLKRMRSLFRLTKLPLPDMTEGQPHDVVKYCTLIVTEVDVSGVDGIPIAGSTVVERQEEAVCVPMVLAPLRRSRLPIRIPFRRR